MKSSKEILSSVVKTAQMGQIGIRSVQDYAYSHRLKDALNSQLKEYDMIESEAQKLAKNLCHQLVQKPTLLWEMWIPELPQ